MLFFGPRAQICKISYMPAAICHFTLQQTHKKTSSTSVQACEGSEELLKVQVNKEKNCEMNSEEVINAHSAGLNSSKY